MREKVFPVGIRFALKKRGFTSRYYIGQSK
jgi:hypothetical protein